MEEHKVAVPDFLHDYPITFVYSEDVSDMIVRLLDYPPEVKLLAKFSEFSWRISMDSAYFRTDKFDAWNELKFKENPSLQLN